MGPGYSDFEDSEDDDDILEEISDNGSCGINDNL